MGDLKLVFVHGGPGLNCQPERRILTPLLAEYSMSGFFWDEPSRLRPSGYQFQTSKSYNNWLKSLGQALLEQQPDIVVGWSFGALGLLHALTELKLQCLRHVVLIGPTLDMDRVFKTMMSFSELDYAMADAVSAGKLKAWHGQIREFWDLPMQKGVELVWANPQLLSHYFIDPNVLKVWTEALQDPGFQIDFESQEAVLKDLADGLKAGFKPANLGLPISVIYGQSDPVFELDENKAFITPYSESLRFVELSSCGHFPHLEKPHEFLRLVKDFE